MQWCKSNNLILDVDKTKEIIIDFGKTVVDYDPNIINGKCVEIVNCLKFLGAQIANNSEWTTQINVNLKKVHQRM